jgi:hypothetical protein
MLGARLLVPDSKGIRADLAIGPSWQLVSTGMEVTVDEGVSGEEVLGLSGRFEPLHVSLSSSGWPMRVLGPVVQISALSVLDAGKKLALRNAVTPQLVGHDHPWHVLQALQQPSEAQLRQLALGSG